MKRITSEGSTLLRRNHGHGVTLSQLINLAAGNSYLQFGSCVKMSRCDGKDGNVVFSRSFRLLVLPCSCPELDLEWRWLSGIYEQHSRKTVTNLGLTGGFIREKWKREEKS